VVRELNVSSKSVETGNLRIRNKWMVMATVCLSYLLMLNIMTSIMAATMKQGMVRF